MNLHYRTLLTLLAVCPMLWLGAAFAQDVPNPPEPPASPAPPEPDDRAMALVEQFTVALDLSPEQNAALKELLVNTHRRERELQNELREVEKTKHDGVMNILTDEQKRKFRAARGLLTFFEQPERPERPARPPFGITEFTPQPERERRFMERREGPRGPRFERPGVGPGAERDRPLRERIAKEIGVTDEQQEVIRRLVETEGISPREAMNRVLSKEQKERLRELRSSHRPDAPRAEDEAPGERPSRMRRGQE